MMYPVLSWTVILLSIIAAGILFYTTIVWWRLRIQLGFSRLIWLVLHLNTWIFLFVLFHLVEVLDDVFDLGVPVIFLDFIIAVFGVAIAIISLALATGHYRRNGNGELPD